MHCSRFSCHLTLIVFSNSSSTVLRSFTNIACHFSTIDLAKHSFPYAPFNSECFDRHFTTMNAIFYRNALLEPQCPCFSQKKTKRSTNFKIEHQLQYAIKCSLYNVKCSSLARTTRTCLHYSLAWCAIRRQVIIPI